MKAAVYHACSQIVLIHFRALYAIHVVFIQRGNIFSALGVI